MWYHIWYRITILEKTQNSSKAKSKIVEEKNKQNGVDRGKIAELPEHLNDLRQMSKKVVQHSSGKSTKLTKYSE